MTVASVQIQNLLYVVGALVVASVTSGLYVLRHRRPKSVDAGIESFSRELKALAPERQQRSARGNGVRTDPIAVSGQTEPVESSAGEMGPDDPEDERG